MPKNTLYNYINRQVYTKPGEGFFDTKLYFYKNKKQTPYYCFKLPVNEPIEFVENNKKYTLTEQHISIYKNQNALNPSISQYHYTAYFMDNNGKNYQLHVYFNQYDIIAVSPIFSIEKNLQYIPCNIEAFNFSFISLASSKTFPIISQLRSQQLTEINVLMTKHKQLEEQASELSKDSDRYLDKYLIKLDELQAILADLDQLSSHHHYKHERKFIEVFKKTLKNNSQNTQPSTETVYSQELNLWQKTSKQNDEMYSRYVEENSRSCNNKNSTEKTTTLSVVPTSNLHSSACSQSKNPNNQLDEEITKLIQKVDELNVKSNEQNYVLRVELLNCIYEQLGQIMLISDSKHFSTQQIVLLQKIRTTINQHGKSLLDVLMLKGEFLLANQLKPFHYLLTINHLAIALTMHNAPWVNFLLDNGNYAINSQPLTISNTVYPTALHYCFKHKKNDVLSTECFSVLLEHGAFLLLPNDIELPLAHEIFTAVQYEHPFYTPLHNFLNKYTKQVQFYLSLASSLKKYMSNIKLNAKERRELEHYINFYKLMAKYNNNHNVICMNNKSMLNTENNVRKNIYDHSCNTPFFIKLQTDPDIVALQNKIEEVKKRHLSILNYQEIRTTKSDLQEKLNILDKIDFNTLENHERVKTFQKLKDEQITAYRDLLQSLELKYELSKVRYELQHGKHGKKLKREEEFLAQSNHYADSYIKNKYFSNSTNITLYDNDEELNNSLANLLLKMDKTNHKSFATLKFMLQLGLCDTINLQKCISIFRHNRHNGKNEISKILTSLLDDSIQNHLKKENLDNALKVADFSLDLMPNDPIFVHHRIKIYLKKNETNEILKDIDKLLQFNDDDLFKLNGYALLEFYALKKSNQNMLDFNSCLNGYSHPNMCRIRQEKFKEVLEYINTILKLEFNNITALTWRSQFYFNERKYHEALKDINILLEICPTNIVAFSFRSKIYLLQGQLNKAVQDVEKVLQLKPKHFLGILWRSEIYFIRGQLIESLQYINAFLQLCPFSGYALFRRAQLYRQFYRQNQDYLAMALQDINTVLQFEPKNFLALVFRSEIYLLQKNLDAALQALTEIVTLYPNSRYSFQLRSNIYRRQHKLKEAILDENSYMSIPYSYRNGSFPSLISLAKVSFFKHEPNIYKSGQVCNMPNKDDIKTVLAKHNVNAITLTAMRELHNHPANDNSIFEQLNSMN